MNTNRKLLIYDRIRDAIGKMLAKHAPLSVDQITKSLNNKGWEIKRASVVLMLASNCEGVFAKRPDGLWSLDFDRFMSYAEVRFGILRCDVEATKKRIFKKENQCLSQEQRTLQRQSQAERRQLKICRQQVMALRKYLKTNDREVLESLPKGYGPAETSPSSCPA